ncbi:cell envelope stress-induced membrane anchor protein LiaI [Bacillus vallismortis]|uniref:cell envelope stress-induced membrane anchor protein LiaI n=1 Tax=Bacillus vallismortis TaxID=72361 RepID=UPI000EF46669|nr:cell envelope stress-induced membrane anchor protein LiaI [Bacillus vallismortis]MCI3986590.1 protein liaI [Bacillus vallismortis]MCI4138417.1 protein liaI [Bacillus vallismortis]MCY7892098.1 protein liaI [Bacillus vallismortis]MCY8532991.1 protein liaI [Bacillus vallismortis]MCY8548280.1 protein liaI [Bacillus vallismortis]
MKINMKTIGGFLFIVFGISVFFGGGSFGFIIPLAIGALMTYAGIKRFAAGKAITGIIVGGIGAIMLICSLPFIVGLALAAAMVYYGWKLMKNGSADNDASSFGSEPSSAAYQSHFDAEWEEFLKKK